jgi:hypothetical protein
LYESTAASNTHYVAQTASLTSGTTYTFSVYLKAGERTQVRLRTTGTGSTSDIYFNLSTGVITSSSTGSGTITSVGNGWYRCTATGSSDLTGSNNTLIMLLDGAGSSSYTGDGYSGIYIWGAQLEAGAFSTSYIPTVASQVTRSADAASMTGTNFSSWYNQGEGTIYSEYSHASTTTNNPAALSVNNNGNTNQIVIYGEGAVGEKFFVRTNGTIQASITASSKFANGVMGKVAGAYNINSFSASANGATAVSDSAGLVPAVYQMNIGNEYNGSLPLNGTIKKIAYYPMRVTNTNLQSLTT